jgi:branched-chain amino acid transport system substrate-binding protein
VYAVQGYDAAQMLGIGPECGEGRHQQERPRSPAAMRKATIDSPRGKFT